MATATLLLLATQTLTTTTTTTTTTTMAATMAAMATTTTIVVRVGSVVVSCTRMTPGAALPAVRYVQYLFAFAFNHARFSQS
jgi:hypothetical protein